jgi:hypothetical protein
VTWAGPKGLIAARTAFFTRDRGGDGLDDELVVQDVGAKALLLLEKAVVSLQIGIS